VIERRKKELVVVKGLTQIWTIGKVVPIALALVLAGGWVAYSKTPPVSAVTEERVNTITVSGKGEVSITPDVAYVQFGLNTEGNTAQEAQQKNAKLFSQIQEAIIKQGVEQSDIKTVVYNTHPDYKWEKEQNVLKGYRSDHIVEVTYRKMDSIGSLVDTVTKAGVNRIDNIRFGTEKENEYAIKALENAVDHAKKKAEALATKSGKKVKDVIAIQESGTSNPPVMYREAASEKAASLDASTTINQGELKVTAHVQVTYEF
jgi:uncharacterized protein YggE